MTTGTCVSYAEKRTRDHLARFNGIYLQLIEDRIEESWIAELEWLEADLKSTRKPAVAFVHQRLDVDNHYLHDRRKNL